MPGTAPAIAVDERRPLVIGTRGSALARAQTGLVADELRRRGWPLELVVVRTGGDAVQREASMPLARGAFVAELERALVKGRIDAAVHSAKDLPTEERDGVAIAAYPARGEPRDALVSRTGAGLDGLERGARVGTESPRRRAFVLRARPDLEVVPIRGNVDTRLARLDRGEVDALILAAAGLERLGLAGRIAEVLAFDRMVPAVGQGALAVQSRRDDPVGARLGELDDVSTRHAVEAERAFLRAMGGGCRAPFAAHATVDGESLELEGAAVEPSGRQAIRDRCRGPSAEAATLGRVLAERLLERGAGALAGRARVG